MIKKSIAIIGGGPSALLLAAFLDAKRFEVTIYEKNKSSGRKFLVAGKGGFNLSHSEAMETFVLRYTPDDFLKSALCHFDNLHLRQWLETIGIPTFVGSSKRVYPIKGIKPIEVLNKILAVLKKQNVQFKYEHEWTGWNDEGHLIFNSNRSVKADYTVFALGGGSWKVTGSDGKWLSLFSAQGINTQPFQASNCAYAIKWPGDFIHKNEGQPLKNISITCGSQTQKGEVVITRFGMEGNAIYALSPQIQNQLQQQNQAAIFIDLKPALSKTEILQRITNSKEKKTSDTLRKVIKLSTTQTNLLKAHSNKTQFLNPESLATQIKKLPLLVNAAAPLDEAISTSGGIALDAVDSNFELKKLKHIFCIGEMLDWNAPTGGYLLQACFSMGVYLARHLNEQ